MRLLNVQQGSIEWLEARLGRPTASRFDCILTPKTRKPSAQAGKYLRELLAERLLGYPVEQFTSDWMERGKELEPQAALWYEMTHGVETQQVGFMLTDDGRIGASPDRLVGSDGMVEFKCLSAAAHVAAMLDPEGAAMEHFSQVQGQFHVAGPERVWNDLVFFNPEMPSVKWRFTRDADYIAALDVALRTFCDSLDASEEQVRREYGLSGPGPAAPAAHGTVAARDAAGVNAGAMDGATVSVERPLSDIEKAYQRKNQKPQH